MQQSVAILILHVHQRAAKEPLLHGYGSCWILVPEQPVYYSLTDLLLLAQSLNLEDVTVADNWFEEIEENVVAEQSLLNLEEDEVEGRDVALAAAEGESCRMPRCSKGAGRSRARVLALKNWHHE